MHLMHNFLLIMHYWVKQNWPQLLQFIKNLRNIFGVKSVWDSKCAHTELSVKNWWNQEIIHFFLNHWTYSKQTNELNFLNEKKRSAKNTLLWLPENALTCNIPLISEDILLIPYFILLGIFLKLIKLSLLD